MDFSAAPGLKGGAEMLSDDEFRRLLKHLDRPWDGFRKVRKGVKKRVRRHMQVVGCTGIDAYLDLLKRNPEVYAECQRCLAVTISRFFRDRRLWDHLRARVLPGLIKRFPDRLAAWSAGCANGEEPYTLAMIWEELAASLPSVPNLEILATDAEASFILRAEAGRYPPSSFREMPEGIKNRWFGKERGGRWWQIDAYLRERVRWRVHHLLEDPPTGRFQLILLRNNILTYYQGPGMIAAMERITATLTKGGVLVVGSHERPPPLSIALARDPGCPWLYRV
jgi:chemotaxis protein methyltransferase CheR